MDYIMSIMPALLMGTWFSIKLFIIVLILSLPLGLPIALGENSRFRPIKWLCKLYVLIFRGTPLLLQLFFFYFFFPIAFGITLDAFPTACLTFILNYAAYFAEIYRGGINGIDVGQYEASHSLGLTKTQTMFGVIIPQMLRTVLPAISNEAIILIKDTALASTITYMELMKAASSAVNRDVNVVPYIIAAILYLLFSYVVTAIAHRVEKYFMRFDAQEEA